ncbi:hypothetical protein MMC30_005891 [Trapelia coarctata]|nr:hypothetical protein [Trapelia coarctata]
MTDPHVWSNLPTDILYCIIDQTDDRKTLGNWMRTCKALRQIVGLKIWSEVLFLCGFFKARLRSGSFIRLKAGYRVLPLEDDRVKTLYLSGFYALPPRVDGEMAHMLVSEKVAQTINAGLRNLSLTKAIVQKGVLWQDFIDRIARESRLSTLKIRGGNFRPAKRTTVTVDFLQLQVCHASGLRLKFEGLAFVSTLRRLSISCLLPGEGHGLAGAVKRLSNLEVLRLQVATPDYPFYLGQEDVPEVSPLDEFLRRIYLCPTKTGHLGFGGGPTYGFPLSLRELALVDRTSSTTKLTSSFFATNVIPHPNLESFMIRMDCIHKREQLSLSSVLAVFLSPKITHLHFSPHEALQTREHSPETEARALVSTLYPFRNSIKFWGLPAWGFFYYHRLPTGAILERLFDGVPCYRQVRLPSRRREQKLLSCYLFDRSPAPVEWRRLTHHGMTLITGSWGRGVRHMRVEDVDVNGLIVDHLPYAYSSLTDLKVLIVTPRPAHSDKQPQLHPRTTAYNIAAGILRQRLPGLRVVVVGEYRFWLELPDLFSKGPWRVWGLMEALEDARQAIDVERCLERPDWRFLNGQEGVEESSMIIRRDYGFQEGGGRGCLNESVSEKARSPPM